MGLTQFEKSKVICKRCEERIAKGEDAEYWQGYYRDFKKAMIADHGEVAKEWLAGR